MLLQAITIDDRAYAVETGVAQRSSGRYIFPNGCLPSIEVIARCVARGPTCRRRTWRTSRPTTRRRCAAGARTSTRRRTELGELGYDERFQRLWRLYLRYCEAGFVERRIGVAQMVLAKPRWVATPLPAAVCTLPTHAVEDY